MLLQSREMTMELGRPNRINKKRKAENSDNERLSKRLSLLNLDRTGQKLYVPVEAPPSASSSTSTTTNNAFPKPFTQTRPSPAIPSRPEAQLQDDTMQLDDTKHKVYIYDLDAELSDSDTSDDGKLVFLPDIAKHLRETRIPPSILANKDGELAGMNQELVLYNIPSSLTVPEEQDGVRKAIIEARARMRAKIAGKNGSDDAPVEEVVEDTPPERVGALTQDLRATQIPWNETETMTEDDVDAMDLG